MRIHARRSALVGFTFSLAASASAQQSLTVRITAADDSQPLPYSTVTINPPGQSRFTSVDGRIMFGALATGTYRLSAREIGFAPADTTIDLADGVPPSVTLALRRVPITLARIVVHGERSKDCLATGIPDSAADPDIAAVFRELRLNVDRVRLLTREYPLQYRLERRMVRRRAGDRDSIIRHDTVQFSDSHERYRPGNVVYFDLDQGRRTQFVRLISFADLADSVFQSTHCFDFDGQETVDGVPSIKIVFRAARDVRTPDVEGTIYLDANRYVVRRADFHLSHPERAKPPIGGMEVTTTFREVAPLITIFETVEATQPAGQERAIETDRLVSFAYVARAPGQQ